MCVDFFPSKKVADFGLSTFVSHKVGGAIATWNWQPPEALVEQGSAATIEYDEQVDVYSFAIVMWEIVSRKYPFEEDYFEQFKRGIFFDDRGCRKAVIEEKLRPPISSSHLPCYCTEKDRGQWEQYCQLMKDCWEHQPQNRPKFREIRRRLGKLLPQLVRQCSLLESQMGSGLGDDDDVGGDDVLKFEPRAQVFFSVYYFLCNSFSQNFIV